MAQSRASYCRAKAQRKAAPDHKEALVLRVGGQQCAQAACDLIELVGMLFTVGHERGQHASRRERLFQCARQHWRLQFAASQLGCVQ
jgi:hypothetical protein